MTTQSRTAEPPAGAARAPVQGTAQALEALARGQETARAEARAAARPWWFDAPGVGLACARVAAAPFVAVVRVAEAAVAVALLAALGTAAAWHFGILSDHDVVAALKPVGQRILAMVQNAGASQ